MGAQTWLSGVYKNMELKRLIFGFKLFCDKGWRNISYRKYLRPEYY